MIKFIKEGKLYGRFITVSQISDGGFVFAVRFFGWFLYFRQRGKNNPAIPPRYIFNWGKDYRK